MIVPDPNTFGGPVLLMRPEDVAATHSDPGLRTGNLPLTPATRRFLCCSTTT